jgi:diaminopimelate decarboxylase
MQTPPPEDALLREAAERFGTPLFVFDVARLRANVQRFQRAFAECAQHTDIFYSVKTNYLPHLLRMLPGLGLGADVVSGFELQAALAAGVAPRRITFNGPLKTEDELRTAVDQGIRVNVDGIPEVRTLERLAAGAGRTVEVGVRVNPGRNPYLSNDPSFNAQAARRARQSKFGWLVGSEALDELLAAVEASPHLALRGVHCHIGSQITDTAALVAALEEVLRFVKGLAGRFEIRQLNMGGGFGVPGIRRDRSGPLRNWLQSNGVDTMPPEDAEFDLQAFAAAVKALLRQHGLEHLSLAAEPGRFLVSDAFQLVTRVANVKPPVDGRQWVVIDGGLNLMPTAGPAETHRFEAPGKRGEPTAPFMLGGPLCYEGDVWSYAAQLPASIAPGDLLAIQDAGAYSVSRSTNFIRPRAAVAALDGRQLHLCWRRETCEDVFRFDQPLSA